MSIWRVLGYSVFTGERSWAWRRRTVFAGCAMALAGVAKAAWFEPDKAWAAVLLSQSWTAFGATIALYLGAAGFDEHHKRKLGADDKTTG